MAEVSSANKNPLEELVAKVSGLREQLESAAKDLVRASEELRSAVRYSSASELSGSYLAFASAHMRLARAAGSEFQRAALTETRITRAKAAQEREVWRETRRKEAAERRQRTEEEANAEAQRKTAAQQELLQERQQRRAQEQQAFSLPPVDTSFEELYGDMIDAE